MWNKGSSSAAATANHEPERPQFSTNKNGCYYSLTTAILSYLQRLSFENTAELDAKTQRKQLAVMILDESFRVVGEFELPKDIYKYRNVFVSREGLHVNALSEDDDYLRFVTLVPEK